MVKFGALSLKKSVSSCWVVCIFRRVWAAVCGCVALVDSARGAFGVDSRVKNLVIRY